jgi:hypothetical protein
MPPSGGGSRSMREALERVVRVLARATGWYSLNFFFFFFLFFVFYRWWAGDVCGIDVMALSVVVLCSCQYGFFEVWGFRHVDDCVLKVSESLVILQSWPAKAIV